MNEEYLEQTLTKEQYDEIIATYGDLSTYIKSQTYDYKEKTTKQLNRTKKLFFVSLVAGVSYIAFKEKMQKDFNRYKGKIDKDTEKAYKEIIKRVGGENLDGKTGLNQDLYTLYKQFQIDMESTKTADDKFIRVIADYYKRTKTTYDKEWVDKKEYLSGLVGRYDKQEKVIAYRNKDGSVRAYFDIASYDSMVYNTNLTNTGVLETINDAIRRDWDIAYIDPHLNSCPLCQEFQGRFISLTGASIGQIYNGQLIRDSLDTARNQGFLHPNCSHVPRRAYPEDRIDMKWNNAEAVQQYENKQKQNALRLKKSRLKNDLEIYEQLDNQEKVDKTKQQIRNINKRLRLLK